MATASVALILGAGSRVGAAIAQHFATNGYKIALASRSGIGAFVVQGFLSLKADFAHPDSIATLLDAVEIGFNSSPSVIVYNAGSLTNPPDKNSVLSIPTDSVTKDFIVNTVSPHAAAQQAVERWSKLPHDVNKTFHLHWQHDECRYHPHATVVERWDGKVCYGLLAGTADHLYKGRNYRCVAFV